MRTLKKNYIFLPYRLRLEIQRYLNGSLLWFNGQQSTLIRHLSNTLYQARLTQTNLKIRNEYLYLSEPLILITQNFLKIWKNVDIKTRKKRLELYKHQIKKTIINTQIGVNKFLSVRGVGYKFIQEKNYLKILVGFSHFNYIYIPNRMLVKMNRKNTKIKIKYWNEIMLLGWCAIVRKLKPPEVYKGKGIRYKKEKLIRKEGKKKKTF